MENNTFENKKINNESLHWEGGLYNIAISLENQNKNIMAEDGVSIPKKTSDGFLNSFANTLKRVSVVKLLVAGGILLGLSSCCREVESSRNIDSTDGEKDAKVGDINRGIHLIESNMGKNLSDNITLVNKNEQIFIKEEPAISVREDSFESENVVKYVPKEFLRVVDSSNPISKEEIETEILPKLVKIQDHDPDIWLLNESLRANEICLDDLSELFQQAHKDGISLYIRSAFRDYDDQLRSRNNSENKNAVASLGSSQHHTGLAFDFTTPEIQNRVDVNANFSGSIAGKWLLENAWKYGFVLSYTNNHDGVLNEDWHYYYVGKEIAEIWHNRRLEDDGVDIFMIQEEIIKAMENEMHIAWEQ